MVASPDADLPEYSQNELGRHCTHDDLWIAYKGKVYNVTPYFNCHPGGNAILRQAGKDATIAIMANPAHGMVFSAIEEKIEKHCIGKLKR